MDEFLKSQYEKGFSGYNSIYNNLKNTPIINDETCSTVIIFNEKDILYAIKDIATNSITVLSDIPQIFESYKETIATPLATISMSLDMGLSQVN